MKIHIEPQQSTETWRYKASSGLALRVYAHETFQTSNGEIWHQGSPFGPYREHYIEYPLALNGGKLSYPDIEIDPTEDSPTHADPKLSAYVFAGDRNLFPHLLGFTIPPAPEMTTWEHLQQRRDAMRGPRPFRGYYEEGVVENLILRSLGERAVATINSIGMARGSAPAVDPMQPIHVSVTDPLWNQLLAGNLTPFHHVSDHNFVGDGVTDNTVAFQTLLNTIGAAGLDATIFFPVGRYIIAGALQDVALSNSQIVLPKRNSPEQMITIQLLGETPPAQAWMTHSGVIIESTLLAGNGAMIGVRHDRGFPGGNENNIAHNGCSWLSFRSRNINFRMPANPTNSCLDLRWLPNIHIADCRVDVVGIDAFETNGAGGGEGSGPAPDLRCAEPTTPTSYGIKMPIDYNPNLAMLENVEVLGYYTAIRGGELMSGDNITLGLAKVGIEVFGGQHPSNFKKLLSVSCGVRLKAGGADPIFAPGGTPTAIINIQQMDIENSSGLLPWAATNVHIDDPNHYLHGDINWFQGLVPGQGLIINGGGNLNPHNVTHPFHGRAPFTEITGGNVQFQDAGSDHAVDETYRGLPTNDNTRIAWKLLTSHQSGLNHLLGILAFNNAAIAGNKRLAQIAALTDGALNSGSLEFWTMNAGALARRAWFDHFGNFNLTGLFPRGVGPDLAIAGNTITPTFAIHVVGAGLIKNITVPPIVAGAGVTIMLIPSAAFTYDNTGNIGGNVGGAAIIGKSMLATWVPTLAKWAMSY